MSGLLRAELLRLRKRRPLQVIVLAVPLLVAVLMVLGYNSLFDVPPFDEAAYRQELIDSGYTIGLPPEEGEALLKEAIDSQRLQMELEAERMRLGRAAFTFPYSLTMALGTGAFTLLALVLLTATTIGDEFSWATIRTSLLASTNRRRFLLVRLFALIVASLVMFGLLLVVGTVLPPLLSIPASKLPATLPEFDFGALLVMLGGEALAGLAVIAFAGVVTLIVRSGALTLVSALVWIAVEAAVLTLLMRFPNFAGTYANNTYTPGSETWLLDAFPLRGITMLMQTAGRAASGLAGYPGDVVDRTLTNVATPIASFAIIALLLVAIAFRRFQRMDIVE